MIKRRRSRWEHKWGRKFSHLKQKTEIKLSSIQGKGAVFVFIQQPFTYISTKPDNSQMLIHSFHPVSWLTGVFYSDLASSCFQLLNSTSTAVLRVLPVMTGAHLVQCFLPVLIFHPAFCFSVSAACSGTLVISWLKQQRLAKVLWNEHKTWRSKAT